MFRDGGQWQKYGLRATRHVIDTHYEPSFPESSDTL